MPSRAPDKLKATSQRIQLHNIPTPTRTDSRPDNTHTSALTSEDTTTTGTEATHHVTGHSHSGHQGLVISSINVASFHRHGAAALHDAVNADIVLMQEHRCTRSQLLSAAKWHARSGWHCCIGTSLEEDAVSNCSRRRLSRAGGLVVRCRGDRRCFVDQSFRMVGGEVSSHTLHFFGFQASLINVHRRAASSTRDYVAFERQVELLINAFPKTRPIIIAGDWNHDSDSNPTTASLQAVQGFRLCTPDCPTRFSGKRCIDYGLIRADNITHLHTDVSEDVYGDHKMVSMYLHLHDDRVGDKQPPPMMCWEPVLRFDLPDLTDPVVHTLWMRLVSGLWGEAADHWASHELCFEGWPLAAESTFAAACHVWNTTICASTCDNDGTDVNDHTGDHHYRGPRLSLPSSHQEA